MEENILKDDSNVYSKKHDATENSSLEDNVKILIKKLSKNIWRNLQNNNVLLSYDISNESLYNINDLEGHKMRFFIYKKNL